MSDYQVTMYSDNFKDFLKIQQQKRGFSMMMVINQKHFVRRHTTRLTGAVQQNI